MQCSKYHSEPGVELNYSYVILLQFNNFFIVNDHNNNIFSTLVQQINFSTASGQPTEIFMKTKILKRNIVKFNVVGNKPV